MRALGERLIGPHARLDSNCGRGIGAASTPSSVLAHPPEVPAFGGRALRLLAAAAARRLARAAPGDR